SRSSASSASATPPSTTSTATHYSGASARSPTSSCTPSGPWPCPVTGAAQPKRLRLWLLRLPGKLTGHARKSYLQLLRDDPVSPLIIGALLCHRGGLPPPIRAQA